jgi:hypothetical protein
MIIGVGVGVGDGLGDGDGLGEGEGDGLGDGLGEGEGDGLGDGLGVGVAVWGKALQTPSITKKSAFAQLVLSTTHSFWKPPPSIASLGTLEQVFAYCATDGSSHEGVVPLDAPSIQSGVGMPTTP